MMLNLGTAFVAASVIHQFAATIERLVALASFMPVVAGMGGNTGVQALTVITRGIALGEIEFSSGMRTILKEVSVGSAIGACIGGLAALVAWLWQGSPLLGAVLFVAMLLTMTIAALLGAAVPLLLKALRQDPAVGSGVIVTTLTDNCAFFTFLGIATLLLDRLT
jgi:magnesium transporter